MAKDDERKARKVEADKSSAKKKDYYTKQRRTAEAGAADGDVKAKATRDKIYSKIGRKPGPDAEDADVVNKGALSMVGGPEALGTDAAMGLGRMALGKVGMKLGGEGMGKIAGDVMSKFGKGGKTADKAAPKTMASGRTVKATAKGIDKGSKGHKGLGNLTMKQAPKKIDGQAGHQVMARKSVKGGNSPTAKAAVKSSTSGVESASTKRMKEYDGIGKDRIASKTKSKVKASDKSKYEAGKKTGAEQKRLAGAQAKRDYNASAKGPKAKPVKVEKGETIDGQTGKTIKTPKKTSTPKKAKAPKAAPKADEAAKPKTTAKSFKNSAKGNRLSKMPGGGSERANLEGKFVGKKKDLPAPKPPKKARKKKS